MGAIIAASARFFTIAKWVAAAYLIYLGLKALLSAHSMHSVALDEHSEAKERDLSGVYFGALTLQLANPKALLFFWPCCRSSSTPQLPGAAMPILAATSMLPESCILTGYGWLRMRVHATARSALPAT